MADKTDEVEQIRKQLLRYAEDLTRTYRAERTRTRELEEANSQLTQYASQLNETIDSMRRMHDELQDAYLDTIQRLAVAAEYRDDDTGDHIVRMSRYAGLLARHVGMPEPDVLNIIYAAPMHDVGKIGIPDDILLKPGKLTTDEFDIMKNHTIIGGSILANPKGQVLRTAREIALSHHERWDGTGYPYGLVGERIPLAGRITAVADVFDALTSKRPYKKAFSVERATNIIREGRETQFDPEVVDVFLDHLDELIAVKERLYQDADWSISGVALAERNRSANLRADRGR